MAILGARRQAALYYARKRNRSLRQVPRLYGTGNFPPSSVQSDAVANVDLDRPITFVADVDLTQTGLMFSWGTSITLTVNATTLVLGFPQGDVTVSHPATGKWTLVLSIRPGDGHAHLWNQFGTLWRTESLATGTWADPDEDLTIGDNVVSMFKLYTAQLPRHFGATGQAEIIAPEPEGNGEFWINSTIIFMNGFDQPLFEGDV